MMIRIVSVQPKSGFRLHVRFSDGVEGDIDLSHLAGRGVFQLWDQPGRFEQVHATEHGSLAWSDEVEICSDAVYLKLAGKEPGDVFTGLTGAGSHA
ncbi:MAG: DUF2442 domain-containing protein [Phycisphaeraceae bacterium]